MSQGFESDTGVVNVRTGEDVGGESKSVDLRVTLDVSDAARGRAVSGLVWEKFRRI